jgi:hypothetical protein
MNKWFIYDSGVGGIDSTVVNATEHSMYCNTAFPHSPQPGTSLDWYRLHA